MSPIVSILFVLLLSVTALRADFVLEQQAESESGGTNQLHAFTVKIHDHLMRMDQPTENVSVLVNLSTHDSTTLLPKDKAYLKRFGNDIRWEVQEEKKYTQGTNAMDAAPAPAVDTGKSETVNGMRAEIYSWTGAKGITETLWVATNFPNFAAIKTELAKLDAFNDTGLHRNAQPALALLPGMVLKSVTVSKTRHLTTMLKAAKVEPVDPAIFNLPDDYKPYKPPETKPPEPPPTQKK